MLALKQEDMVCISQSFQYISDKTISSVCCEDKNQSMNAEKFHAVSYFKEEFEGGRE